MAMLLILGIILVKKTIDLNNKLESSINSLKVGLYLKTVRKVRSGHDFKETACHYCQLGKMQRHG